MIKLIGYTAVMKAIDYKLLERRYKLYTVEELSEMYSIQKLKTIKKIISFSQNVEDIMNYNFAHNFYLKVEDINYSDREILKEKYISSLILIEATNYFIYYYKNN